MPSLPFRLRRNPAARGEYPLGRREPTDFEHVEKYPYSAVAPRAVAHVERVLRLPWWHWGHDQGKEGSCVGHGISMERAITNIAQAKALGLLNPGRRYNPLDVWNEAKKIDEWPDTNPGDDHGTSVRAGYDVCRDKGLVRVISMRMGPDGVPVPYRPKPRSKDEGVQRNRWAGSTDEVRTAVASGLPVAIGVNWYSNFDRPVAKPSPDGGFDHWIGEGDLGRVRGGHSVCIYGASDARQAFKLKNSWGRDYPLVWIPYTSMERLMDEHGEVAIVTDR
jgi:hypothetical protein